MIFAPRLLFAQTVSDIFAGPYALYFRRTDPDDDSGVKEKKQELAGNLSGIRCPLCEWKPSRFSLWTCWDCDYPEYFYTGCGTEWNTFETRGTCPTCLHQWKWTSCLQCAGWSKHEDWYIE